MNMTMMKKMAEAEEITETNKETAREDLLREAEAAEEIQEADPVEVLVPDRDQVQVRAPEAEEEAGRLQVQEAVHQEEVLLL